MLRPSPSVDIQSDSVVECEGSAGTEALRAAVLGMRLGCGLDVRTSP